MNIVNTCPPLQQGCVDLSSDRKLAWSQWGSSKGRPVILCTGAGMTGSLGLAEADLDALDVRLIGIDRPGLGRSTAHPEGTLVTWACDVATLIDRLELKEPAALGFSQGGPFALQLGAVEAVRAVAVVASQDDFDFETVFQQLAPSVTSMINHLRQDKGSFREMIESSATPDWLWTMILSMSSDVDREKYGEEPFASAYQACLKEGFAQGAGGYTCDLLNTWSRWPFRLEELRLPVDIWYGKLDTSPVHSPDFGKTMVARLPNARRFVEEAEGSSILWTCGRRILAELLAR